MSQDGSIYTVESGAHDKSGLSRLPWRAGVRQTDTSVRTAALRPIWLLQLHLTEPQVTRLIRFLPFVAVSLTRDGRGNGCYRGVNTILAVPGWSGYEARGFPGSKKKKVHVNRFLTERVCKYIFNDMNTSYLYDFFWAKCLFNSFIHFPLGYRRSLYSLDTSYQTYDSQISPLILWLIFLLS